MSDASGESTTYEWVDQPVFISSTFRDLHAERDCLRTMVFPILEHKLRERRRRLIPIDLRLGVSIEDNNEAARELEVLRVCLGEVNKCRPFLIVILGDRYGWIPPYDIAHDALRRSGFHFDCSGKSVTEMEIDVGLLDSSGSNASRVLIYCRDPLPYDSMEPKDVVYYSDARSPGPECAANSARLDALKTRLRSHPVWGSRVRPYAVTWDQASRRVTGLDAWAEQVVSDLWSELEAGTPANASPAPMPGDEAGTKAISEFFEEAARDFVGREILLATVREFIGTPQPEVRSLILEGPPGSGKSAICAVLTRQLNRDPAALVLAHVSELATEAATNLQVLRKWIRQIDSRLSAAPADLSGKTLTGFRELLANRLAACEREGVRPILIVDGIEKLSGGTAAQALDWLPSLPPGCRFIGTCDAALEPQTRTGHAVRVESLPPLSREEARLLAVKIAHRCHRELPESVLEAVLSKSNNGNPAAAHPLWLETAVGELNLLDAADFTRAEQFEGSTEERLRQLSLDVIRRMPASAEDLFDWIVERTSRAYGSAWVTSFTAALMTGDTGWRESDLRQLIPAIAAVVGVAPADGTWSDLKSAALRRALGSFITERTPARYSTFAHAKAKQRTAARLQASALSPETIHRQVARFLGTLPEEDALRVREYFPHLIRANLLLEARDYYLQCKLEGPAFAWANEALAGILVSSERAESIVDTWLGFEGLESSRRLELAMRLASCLIPVLQSRFSADRRRRILAAIFPVFEQVMAAPYDRYRNHRYFAGLLEEFSTVEADAGRLAQAREYLRRCIEWTSKLVLESSDPRAFALDDAALAERMRRLDEIGDKDLAERLRADNETGEALLAREFEKPFEVGSPQENRLVSALAVFGVHMANKPKRAADSLLLAKRLQTMGEYALQVGDRAAAGKAFNDGLEAVRQARSYSAPVTQCDYASALALLSLGYVAMEDKRFDAAREPLSDALAIARRTVAAEPYNSSVLSLLASCLAATGALESSLGLHHQAIQNLNDSNRLWERLATDFGAEHRVSLAKSLVNLAHVEHRAERLKLAVHHYQQGLELLQRLEENRGHDLELTAAVGDVSNTIADLLYGQGQYPEALTYAGTSWRAQSKLAEAMPLDLAVQRQLAVRRYRMAMALLRNGRQEEARSCFDDAEAVVLRMAARAPKDVIEESLSAIREGQRAAGFDVASPPETGRQAKSAAARQLHDNGRKAFERGDSAAGFDQLERAAALLEELAAVDERDGQPLKELAAIYLVLAACEHPRAARYGQQGARIEERRNRLQPDSKAQGARVFHILTGISHLKRGDLQSTRACFQKDLDQAEALAKAAPGDLHAKAELANALQERGSLFAMENDLAGALESFRQARDLRDQILIQDPVTIGASRSWLAASARVTWLTAARDLGAGNAMLEQLAQIDRLAYTDPRALANMRATSSWWLLMGSGSYWIGETASAQTILSGAFFFLDRLDRVLPDLPEVWLDCIAVVSRLEAVAFEQQANQSIARLAGIWLGMAAKILSRANITKDRLGKLVKMTEGVEALCHQERPDELVLISGQRDLLVALSEPLAHPGILRECAFLNQLMADAVETEDFETYWQPARQSLEKLHAQTHRDSLIAHALLHCLFQGFHRFHHYGDPGKAVDCSRQVKVICTALALNHIQLEPYTEKMVEAVNTMTG